MRKYDIKSTLLYALGRAIETEDDFEVQLQLEDLEDKLTRAYRKVEEKKLSKMLGLDVPPMELKVPYIKPKNMQSEKEIG